MEVTNIVLTGGPCAGKTTALAYLREKLEEYGFLVLTVPEAASLCITAGLHPSQASISRKLLQDTIFRINLALEEHIFRSAMEIRESTGGEAPRIVVLLDRGLMDGLAYIERSDFDHMLAVYGFNTVKARDERYAAIIHLTTAALGAPTHYTTVNNSAREESIAEAAELDQKTLSAWVGHPRLRVVDNRSSFADKLKRVLAEVLNVLGMPIPVERERKFLVRFQLESLPSHAQRIDIEQRYLVSAKPGWTLRIRKRGQAGCFSYYLTEKQDLGLGERLEIERTISEKEYLFASQIAHPDMQPLLKTRICFLYANQYFELDVFQSSKALPDGSNGLLELELTTQNQSISFPGWLEIQREVTGNPEFDNASISARI